MKPLILLVLIAITVPGSACSADTPAPTLDFIAKKIAVVLSEEPAAGSGLPPRTLNVLSYNLPQADKFAVSWKVAGDKLVLTTSRSTGPALNLPPGFSADFQKISDQIWQIGTFTRKGKQWALTATIETE